MRAKITTVFLVLSMFFESCVSDRARISKQSHEIVNAIRDSDFIAFENYMDKSDFKKNEENHIFYFKQAHNYIKKYLYSNQHYSYEIGKEGPLHITQVFIPLFEGFDSSNGLRKAVLVLSFRPSTPYSRYSEFNDININEDLDVAYRHDLFRGDTTIPKLDLDSTAIKKMNETPLFNQ